MFAVSPYGLGAVGRPPAGRAAPAGARRPAGLAGRAARRRSTASSSNGSGTSPPTTCPGCRGASRRSSGAIRSRSTSPTSAAGWASCAQALAADGPAVWRRWPAAARRGPGGLRRLGLSRGAGVRAPQRQPADGRRAALAGVPGLAPAPAGLLARAGPRPRRQKLREWTVKAAEQRVAVGTERPTCPRRSPDQGRGPRAGSATSAASRRPRAEAARRALARRCRPPTWSPTTTPRSGSPPTRRSSASSPRARTATRPWRGSPSSRNSSSPSGATAPSAARSTPWPASWTLPDADLAGLIEQRPGVPRPSTPRAATPARSRPCSTAAVAADRRGRHPEGTRLRPEVPDELRHPPPQVRGLPGRPPRRRPVRPRGARRDRPDRPRARPLRLPPGLRPLGRPPRRTCRRSPGCCGRTSTTTPQGRYAGDARDYLDWWDQISEPGEYRVTLKRGQVEKDVGKYLAGGGPDLGVVVFVNGVQYGPIPIRAEHPRPDLELHLPPADPLEVRLAGVDPHPRLRLVLRRHRRLSGSTRPKGDPLAMRLLVRRDRPRRGAAPRLVFESDFRIPRLPRPGSRVMPRTGPCRRLPTAGHPAPIQKVRFINYAV